ncbi:hypothetical protein MY5147_000530 [Beauveria neobassiana]
MGQVTGPHAPQGPTPPGQASQCKAFSQPPPLPQPLSPDCRPPESRPSDAEQGDMMAIKERHVTAQERAGQKPQSPSKRPHSAVVEDSPTPDTLVSSWLDSVYPTAKRIRRNSEPATDEVAAFLEAGESSKVNQVNTRPRASSEPFMARGDDGFVQPPTPSTIKSARFSQGYTAASGPATSSRAASYRTGGGTSSPGSLVDAEHYRRENLAERNGIELRHPDDPLPSDLQALVESLGLQQPPATPTAADEKFIKAIRVCNNGLPKPLETFIRPLFDDCIFPKPLFDDLLLRIDSLIMKQTTLPTKLSPADLKKLSEEARQVSKISIPVPDILYGYSFGVLPTEFRKLLSSVLGDVQVVNAADLVLPFLVVEFKGDGGSMWSCTNQCLGGSAACVNVGRRLNIGLVAKDQNPSFNSAVFSIAMNGDKANLYVSWKPKSDAAEYYMQRIGFFAIEDMHDLLILQRTVREIIDWGLGPRLDEIRECLGLAGSKKRKQSERPSGDVKELESQLKEPKTQVEELETQVEELKAQELQAQLDELKTQMKELIKTQVEELRTQVEEPKAQVEEPKAQVEGPKAQEFQAQLDELKTQMKDFIKAQMEEPKAQMEEPKAQMEELKEVKAQVKELKTQAGKP